MTDVVYIISYFGKDPKVQEKRKDAHKKQIDWIKELLPDVPIFVYAQNYGDDDFLDGVNYITHRGELQTPAVARNQLLKHFYASDYDWCMFCDNDAMLYPDENHLDSNHFPKSLGDIKDQMGGIDAFVPIDPRKRPFKKAWEEQWHLLKDNYLFKRTIQFKTSLFFLKNLKKHKNLEIYFDERLARCEDGEFPYQLIYNGCTTWLLENIVLREICVSDKHSTIIEEVGMGNRANDNEQFNEIILAKWQDYGAERNNKKWTSRKFLNKYWTLGNTKQKLVSKDTEGLFV